MSRKTQAAALLAGLMLATVSLAQTPANAPAGATALCKDRTYWSNPTRQGACSGHNGVQTWYATDGAGSGNAPAAGPSTAATPTPEPAAMAATTAAPAKTTSATPPANAAAGGGPGLVWVNSSSKVYHCQGDRWYGKTKSGSYMSEADAKAQGNRPDRGKTCQ